ncbi:MULTISPECIES: hypothetical protein [unclassified Streptomyces]|uniref:hypothetical protein n=1 Tax=unclassified Streptomyces TaxID=2593676 RepID=UPI00278BD287|nr:MULTISPECIES: hypothetical protein [unclassified Streptomyces]
MFAMLLLLGAVILGAGLVFGFHAAIIGLMLMVGGVIGLTTLTGVRRLPGERAKVVEERHYIGGREDFDHRAGHWR